MKGQGLRRAVTTATRGGGGTKLENGGYGDNVRSMSSSTVVVVVVVVISLRRGERDYCGLKIRPGPRHSVHTCVGLVLSRSKIWQQLPCCPHRI